MNTPYTFTLIFFLVSLSSLLAKTAISTPLTTTVSPNGQKIAFSWSGDIWLMSKQGGTAKRFTNHPATEIRPIFSHDGKSIFFNSNRNGKYQIFKKSISGGPETQLTKHTEHTFIEDITKDGKKLIAKAYREYSGKTASRLYWIPLNSPNLEELIFDSHASSGKISPNGKKILFTKDGVTPYRKGYKGSQAGQIWLYDIDKETFIEPVKSNTGMRWPRWAASNDSFYYVSQQDGTFNLYKYTLTTKKSTQLTHYKDDGIIMPSVSSNGETIIYRRLFDLYTFTPSKTKKIPIFHNHTLFQNEETETVFTKTKDIDFSDSGLEIIMTLNEDIYAMDTILKEPIPLTKSAEIESNIYFGDKTQSIIYLKDDGINNKLCKLTRKDPSKYWWQKQKLEETTLFQSKETLAHFTISPDSEKLAVVTSSGKCFTINTNGTQPRLITKTLGQNSASPIHWSPDSQWLTFSLRDENFNHDIYVCKADGTSSPTNISLHPDNDYNPIWSPDGKKIAYLGNDKKLFIATISNTEKSKNDQQLDKAKTAMKDDPVYKQKTEKKDSNNPEKNEKQKYKILPIDFLTIKTRTKLLTQEKRISKMIWDTDSKSLLVQYSDSPNIYKITISKPKPTKLLSASGNFIKSDNKGNYYLLSKSIPTKVTKDKTTSYSFNCHIKREKKQVFKNIFRLAWRHIRDSFYDARLNNLDWEKVRLKYETEATNSPSSEALERVISKMFGELNASHLGIWLKPWHVMHTPKKQSKEVLHLGLELDNTHKGEGYLIKSIYPESPATKKQSQLKVNEIILSINGEKISTSTPLSQLLYLQPNKPISMTVKPPKGEIREISYQPISYIQARLLKKKANIIKAEKIVKKISNNTLAYTHIKSMDWLSFHAFEEHLYEKGYGKKGLIIDIRGNGGGFVADHLLTILNQKPHAFTIGRNGKPGYPQSRIVYATWTKPIIVLCDQNSFSNAEIFAHAIKTHKRGKLIGVTTGGGVISTGTYNILDYGNMRSPFRGWFDLNGNDMETRGAVPDIEIKQTPKADINNKDLQLKKATEILLKEVSKQKKTHKPARYKSTTVSNKQ